MDKAALLARLRDDLSRQSGRGFPEPDGGSACWQLGDGAALAVPLPPAAVHELAPELPSQWASAAAVAVRWLLRLPEARQACPILWVEMAVTARERGALCATALAGLGLAPERLILVEARKPAEALWALEEGARLPGLAAVVAAGVPVPFTASRRLTLACEASGVPLLHLPEVPAATSAAATRWRVAPLPGVPEPLLPGHAGAPRWRLQLVRARQGLAWRWPRTIEVEWKDGAFCICLAAPLASGAVAARAASPVSGQRAA